MNDETAQYEDDDLIPFTGRLSLFRAAVMLAASGKPTTFREAMAGDILERGADLALQKLRSEEWAATGINPQTRIREAIDPSLWEYARYIAPLNIDAHQMDFVERHNGDPARHPVGLGGTLQLHDRSRRWFDIRVDLAPSSDSEKLSNPSVAPADALSAAALPAEPAEATSARPSGTKREYQSPQQAVALRAIRELWPDEKPQRDVMTDTAFVGAVQKHIAGNNPPSRKTILIASGRWTPK